MFVSERKEQAWFQRCFFRESRPALGTERGTSLPYGTAFYKIDGLLPALRSCKQVPPDFWLTSII